MATDTRWQPFGIPDEYYDEDAPRRSGQRILNVTWRRPKGSPKDEGRASRPPGSVLVSSAAVLLGLLAAGLFVVSLAAQYRYVFDAKHQALPSVIEAVGLDAGMTIFSLLALGLARAGQSARVERALVIACALGSAAMNYAAANDGSPRSVAAYVMPPVFLAVVVDRVVAVVRRHVLGNSDRSAWTGFGRVALYGLRFVLAVPSTAKGLRRQVLILTPLPGTDAAALSPAITNTDLAALPAAPETPGSAAIPPAGPEPEAQVKVTADGGRPRPRGESKTARFLALVKDRHGELAGIDPAKVSRICSELAPEAGLNEGSARSALRPLVLAAKAGDQS
jgi:hypothetical protein